MHMAGFLEMPKINIHNSFTANVLPLLESVKFRAKHNPVWVLLKISDFGSLWFMGSLCFYLSLQPLNFRVWKIFRQKLAIKSHQVHAQSVVCNIGWHKILVRVFHQKLEWSLTSCTQKELKNYPVFGVSEQKPPCSLAHALSKQCYL